MTGRHQTPAGSRPRLRWLAAAALSLVLALAAVLGFSLSAAGAATTVKAQLTLSGLVDAQNPVGGSQIGVHPGDTVEITPSTAPTAGLDQLGLGGLVSGLLNTLAGFQVTADLAGLPGGHANTVITSSTQPLSFTFPKAGTYNFTWSAQQVTLLGIVPIQLNGNQLAQAGIKLNASNQYVGQIVVSDNPPAGGLGIQLPSIAVHPSVPVLGQLPSVSLPGTSLTLGPNPLGSLGGLTGGGGSSGSTGTSGSKPGGSSSSGQTLPVPALVVPGGGNFGVVGGGGGGIFNALPLPDLANTGTSNGLLPLGSSSSSSAAAAPASHQSPAADKTVGLATPKSATGQLSVVLALIAIIALALVAGVYAKLYVLRRD